MYETQPADETIREQWEAELMAEVPAPEFPSAEQLRRDAMLDAGFDPFRETPDEYLARVLDMELPTITEIELDLPHMPEDMTV